MNVRDRALRVLAHQLGHPRGPMGRLVGRFLDRGNERSIAAAVQALPSTPAPVYADLGFGGGVGLRLLLDKAGAAGSVHGVELSDAMLDRARRRFPEELTGGRLTLHPGSLTALPLPDEALSGAITVNTIYFLDDLTAAVTELGRVLQPGGCVVIGLGDPEAMARMAVTAHGFHLRPVREVHGVTEQAGLVVARHDRVGDGPDAAHLLSVTRPPRSHDHDLSS